MKKLQLILNLVFALLIAFLLYQNGVEGNETAPEETDQSLVQTAEIDSTSALRVHYINSDSIYKRYDLVNDLRNDLEQRQAQFRANLEARARKFEEEVKSFQQKASGMSQFEGQQMQKELLEKEQELGQMQQDLSDQLMQMEGEMHQVIRGKIFDELESFKERGVDLILDYSSNSSLLMAGDSLDLTAEVLLALNKAYELGKTEE